MSRNDYYFPNQGYSRSNAVTKEGLVLQDWPGQRQACAIGRVSREHLPSLQIVPFALWSPHSSPLPPLRGLSVPGLNFALSWQLING